MKLLYKDKLIKNLIAKGIMTALIQTAIDETPYLEIPCKIGDRAWTTKKYNGVYRPIEGDVSEIYFDENMNIAVAVKYIAKCRWGETVFATFEEAEKACERKNKR